MIIRQTTHSVNGGLYPFLTRCLTNHYHHQKIISIFWRYDSFQSISQKISIILEKENGVRTISYILWKIISEVNAACLDFRGFPDLCILIQLRSLEWERGGDRIHRKEDIETIFMIFKILLKIFSKTPYFAAKWPVALIFQSMALNIPKLVNQHHKMYLKLSRIFHFFDICLLLARVAFISL